MNHENPESPYDLAHAGDLEGVRVWLQTHFEGINSFVRDGYSLLHVACMFGHENLVRLLVDRMALVNLNADNASRAMPLHLAVGYRDEVVADRIARLLIDNGAELNGVQNGGQTALHHAVARGSVLLVRTLIVAGADPFIEDDQAKTPASLAKDLDDEHHGSEVRSVLATVFSS